MITIHCDLKSESLGFSDYVRLESTVKAVQMDQDFLLKGRFGDVYGFIGDWIVMDDIGELSVTRKDSFDYNYVKEM